MYFPVYNWDFVSAAFWSSIVQCHNCDWCDQLWVIRHRLKRTSEGWSQIDHRLQNAVNLQRFSAGSFTRFSLIRLRSVVNFSMLKFYNNGHLQNFSIFLVFRGTIWWSFWYVPHICGRIDTVHLSLLYLWKAPIWLNGPILDRASCPGVAVASIMLIEASIMPIQSIDARAHMGDLWGRGWIG